MQIKSHNYASGHIKAQIDACGKQHTPEHDLKLHSKLQNGTSHTGVTQRPVIALLARVLPVMHYIKLCNASPHGKQAAHHQLDQLGVPCVQAACMHACMQLHTPG